MNTTAQTSIAIDASRDDVWKALTNPQLIKQYMFGTNVSTDWKVGSPIAYRGEWQGVPYEDKGTILEIIPGHKLVMNYFSPMGGEKDLPENYQIISYEIIDSKAETVLQVTATNNKDAASAKKSTENWNYILKAIKELLEKR